MSAAEEEPEVCPFSQMPKNLEDDASADSVGLDAARQESSIPRTGSDNCRWLYPSSLMFHAALSRKHRPVASADVPAMVAIHNQLNEQTWQEIMASWEQRYWRDCRDVRLKRFRGRPERWSPLAWWYWLRHGVVPFDRHDWVVERCGREVRYVIDYYESGGEFSCAIRPAVDSLDALLTRVKSFVHAMWT